MKLTDEELDERFVTEISMIIEREIAKEDFESSKTYSYLCSEIHLLKRVLSTSWIYIVMN